MKGGEDLPRIEVNSRADWRAWLAAHHTQATSVWAVTWKKESGGPYVAYGELRDEALCWGWIDSLRRTVDDKRTRLLMTPRRPGSRWSAINKARIDALTEAGLMQPAGLEIVARAKADGSWSALDEVETLAVPDDLKRALEDTGATEAFAGFSASSRRGILNWIISAKRPETRARRVAETARLAALGLRVNFPEAKGR